MARARNQVRARPGGERRAAAPGHRRPASSARAGRAWALGVLVAAAIAYANAFGHEFVLDDTRIIRDNVRIRSLAGIPALFASSYWDVEGTHALYRPLALGTYAVNYAVHGLSTGGYTAVNVGLHAAVSLLVLALVRAVGAAWPAAGAAGLLFAVHPVHTEAVTGLAGRPELLAALFFLLALILHRRVPRATHGAAVRAGTLACVAAALLSKESAITLLLVLPAMDAWFPVEDRAGRPATPRARLLADYLPLAAVTVGYLAVRYAVLGGILVRHDAIAPLDNPLVPVATMPLGERIGATPTQAVMTAVAVVLEYARLLVWPARLSPDYSYNQIPLVTSALDPRFLGGGAVIAACAAGIAGLRRRSPLAAFGLAFLALTYSIVSNLGITIGTICAERLAYLPSAGLAIAAAAGAERLAGVPRARRILFVVLGVLVASGTARTWTRNGEWKDEVTLWSAAVRAAPASARVQSEYARVLMRLADEEARAGRVAEAEQLYGRAQSHFETALRIFPSYALPMDGLATIHSLHQRFDEALALYERAVRVMPGSYASVTNWAGLLWDRSRRTAASADELRAQGRAAEADALAREADAGYRQALAKAEQAIAMRPDYAHAHLVRALLMVGYVGDDRAAAAEFEEVLRLDPAHPQRAEIEAQLARLGAVAR